MKNSSNTLSYGMRMFLWIGLFFVVVNLIGLGHISELRVVNLLIIIYFSSKLAKTNVIDNDNISYLSNLGSVFAANILNTILSILGLLLYIQLIDPEYVHRISEGVMLIPADSLMEVIVSILFEGLAGAAVVSFGVMQYWKNYKRTRKKIHFKETN